MRSLFSTLLLMLAAFSATQTRCNALILIQTGQLNPSFDTIYANHRETVLWGAAEDRRGLNRLLSLLSGVDWFGSPSEAQFEPVTGRHAFLSVDWQKLSQSGYFRQRDAWIGATPVFAVGSPTGAMTVSASALLLATGGDTNVVTPLPNAGPWPDGALLVYEARSWQEAQDIAIRSGGRAVIADFANWPQRNWGTYWLSGRGWPVGQLPVDPTTGVAGLIRARNLGKLLNNPEDFVWRDSPSAVDQVGPWIENVSYAGPVALMAIVLVISVVGCAIYILGIEEHGPIATMLFVGIALGPADVLILGALQRNFGLEYLTGFSLLAICISGSVTTLLNFVARRFLRGSHPLFGVCAVGFICCLLLDPRWSLFSGVFGTRGIPQEPEALGCLIACLTGVVAFTRGNGLGVWLGRGAILATLGAGLAGAWWAGGNLWIAVLTPATALVCGEGWMRWPYLFVLAFMPHGGPDPVHFGFAWSPNGCVKSLVDLKATNTFDYYMFLLYPGVGGLLGAVAYVWVMGGEFALRQARRIYRDDPRLHALPWAAAATAAWTVFDPIMLPASIFLTFGGIIALFHDGVWPGEPLPA